MNGRIRVPRPSRSSDCDRFDDREWWAQHAGRLYVKACRVQQGSIFGKSAFATTQRDHHGEIKLGRELAPQARPQSRFR